MKNRFYILAFIAMFLCNIAVSAQERNPNRLILHKGVKFSKPTLLTRLMTSLSTM